MNKIINSLIKVSIINYLLIVGGLIYINHQQSTNMPLPTKTVKAQTLVAKISPLVVNKNVTVNSPQVIPTIAVSNNQALVQSNPTDIPPTQSVTDVPAQSIPAEQPQIIIAPTDVPPTAVPSTEVPPTSAPVTDLFSQVSQHSSQSDCWMIISGHIYNISSYFGQHPGGNSTMSRYCGQDATSAFNSGHQHSAAAVAMLGQYLVQ